jgi:riboflavin-specific deaminase-like protein
LSGALSTLAEKSYCYNAREVYILEGKQQATGTRRPQVTLKWAQSIDGRIATSAGHSRWISGEESRTLAHRLRAEHDAVLVGVGTILADDPSLTVRLTSGDDPLRVIADSTLRTPLSATVLRSRPEMTLLATTGLALQAQEVAVRAMGADVIRLPDRAGRVDLTALLEKLAARGIRTLLVEGGARLTTELLRLRLADRLVLFIAPKIVGSGVDAIGDLAIERIDDALTLDQKSFETLGPDVVFRGRIVWPTPSS